MSNSGEETTGDTERTPKEPTSHTSLENEFNSDIAKEPLRMEDLDAGSVGEMTRKSGRLSEDPNRSRQREDDSQDPPLPRDPDATMYLMHLSAKGPSPLPCQWWGRT